MDASGPAAPRQEPALEAQNERRVRRYAARVTMMLIVVSLGVMGVVVWGSGANLRQLIRVPERFNPVQDICVRLAWVKVVGDEERIRLCSEWIQTSDPSGETHKIAQQTQVVKSADGKLYFDDGQLVDDRLFVLAGFMLVLLIIGLRCRRYLVARYRTRIMTAGIVGGTHSST